MDPLENPLDYSGLLPVSNYESGQWDYTESPNNTYYNVTYHQKVTELTNYLEQLIGYFESLHFVDEHIELLRSSPDTIDIQSQKYSKCLNEILQVIDYCYELKNANILEPTEALLIKLLTDRLYYTRDSIEVLMNDIQGNPNVYKLTLLNHGLPNIFMKEYQISEPFILKVLSSPREPHQVKSLEPEIMCKTPYNQRTKKPKPLIDKISILPDENIQGYKFSCTLSAGTRKDVAHFRFEATVMDRYGKETKIANISPPFLVITNECQYGESLGVLFKYDVFDIQHQKAEVVNANFFVNTLQTYFLESLRQNPFEVRGLSRQELRYLIEYHRLQGVVTGNQCTSFWDWFGKILHKIRYQRHISSLWCNGCILGFVGREDAVAYLANQPVGTFLVRFSESKPGHFAISYKDEFQTIKHILVSSDDFVGRVKSLPDFIRDRPEFIYVLQYIGIAEDRVFKIVHKDEILGSYYAPNKEMNINTGNPYDQLNPIPHH